MSRNLPDKDCCREALLASFLIFGGKISGEIGESSVSTPFPRIARLIFQLLKNASGAGIHWETSKETFLFKRKIYSMNIPITSEMKDFIDRWGIGNKLNSKNLRKSCCKRTFLQGAYLMSGSMNTPRKSYHFEIVSTGPHITEILTKTLEKMEIQNRLLQRKGHEVVYVKRADDLAKLLNILGAHRSLLKFEEIRAIKETKEDVRRRVNCETANLDKTSKAAVRQINYIKLLKEEGILMKLPPGLLEIADLRIQHPDANFRELGEKVAPPLSKSCVNNRLRRLESIAESYVNGILPQFLEIREGDGKDKVNLSSNHIDS